MSIERSSHIGRDNMETPPAGHKAVLLQERELAHAARIKAAQAEQQKHTMAPDTATYLPVTEEDIIAEIPIDAQILRGRKRTKK